MNFPALGRCAVLMGALALAGCATLPSSGPTGKDIRREITDPIGGDVLRIVEVADLTLVPVSTDAAVDPLVYLTAPPTGELTRPGRLVLPINRETLSDAIAMAGGYRGKTRDLAVRVTRAGTTSEFRPSGLLTGPERDARVYPGDRIAILSAPRSFSVMGTPGRVEQLPFSAAGVSLAEAIATAGGANPALGDPEAIFVFRIVADATGKERGMVYHVNMMKAGGYLIAQRFAMRDKDVLYIGNARANQPSKLIQITSQLFAPIVTVTSAVQVLRTN